MPRFTCDITSHDVVLFFACTQARIVPLIVEYDAFWTRYFYRLHRLEQKHAQFQQLTQRTLAAQEEEEVRCMLCPAALGCAVLHNAMLRIWMLHFATKCRVLRFHHSRCLKPGCFWALDTLGCLACCLHFISTTA